MERIRKLEVALIEAESRIVDIFKAGNIPTTADHERIAGIKRELKTLRRVSAMRENRNAPLLTERLTVLLSQVQVDKLRQKAETEKKTLSDVLREIIDNSIC